MQWRVRPVLPVAKLIGAAALPVLVAGFAPDDLSRWALAAVVTAGIVAWALRDLLIPVRLAADADGVTVLAGFARRRRLPWSQIETVRVETGTRRGLRSELLEIDAGDAVYLLSANQLGAIPEDVALALADLRTVS
ncbi:PH domain-containing protein [Actinoplanes sp. NEAU-A12]|uniref:PH domain-containing protein n=1 Tax=Actinoplanes sandaracinus TaxID=3045177 RepID=A0ABT6WHK5_9ACTN|nr:PH domain-containing protein [Actinoplanes sandaracinus]MDI6099204.1 PH domain-containing protein [Actinoplanes sandaracinus]